MSIVLLVLKIMGFILLGILGLFLLILLCVLLVPVFYRMEGGYDGKPELKVRVTWLFPLVCIKGGLDAENKPWYTFCILGYPFRASDKKRKAKKESGKESEEEPGTEKTEEKTELVHGPAGAEAAGEETKAGKQWELLNETSVEEAGSEKTETEKEQPEIVTAELLDEKSGLEESEAEKKQPENTSAFSEAASGKKKLWNKIRSVCTSFAEKVKAFFAKLASLPGKVQELFSNIRQKAGQIGTKAGSLGDKVTLVMDFLGSSKNQQGFSVVLEGLKKILCHLRPGKVSGEVHFGFEDPSSTGMVYGMLTVFYSCYGDSFVIVPDFEQSILEGHIKLKGRIVAGRLAVILLSLWRDKKVKRLLREVRKLRNSI